MIAPHSSLVISSDIGFNIEVLHYPIEAIVAMNAMSMNYLYYYFIVLIKSNILIALIDNVSHCEDRGSVSAFSHQPSPKQRYN